MIVLSLAAEPAPARLLPADSEITGLKSDLGLLRVCIWYVACIYVIMIQHPDGVIPLQVQSSNQSTQCYH